MAGSKQRTKVLYVCPWAHWAGHPPVMLERESRYLQEAGFEVSLCTFAGVLDYTPPRDMFHITVVSTVPGLFLKVLKPMEKMSRLTKAVAWIMEQFSTLYLAISLKKKLKYDILFLRDGDPFIFMPVILGCFTKNRNWFISLFGSSHVRTPGTFFYKLVNASFWKTIYRSSFSRNRFLFFCENRYTTDFYEKDFAGGILAGKTRILIRPIKKPEHVISKQEARSKLGLPADKTIFLHFGLLHQGKAIEPVLDAMVHFPEPILVHAGGLAMGINLKRNIAQYNLNGRVILREYFIPEEEKPLYFAAADALILSYRKNFIQSASMLWESASYKLPIIASDVGELGDLVKQYQVGLLFKPEDSESLQDVFRKYLALSDEERELYARNYVKFIEDLSEENWRSTCTKAFSELTGR
jgi:glycosyltransferase involved in cell wall biosynthesis